jgi:hypothetical protein
MMKMVVHAHYKPFDFIFTIILWQIWDLNWHNVILFLFTILVDKLLNISEIKHWTSSKFILTKCIMLLSQWKVQNVNYVSYNLYDLHYASKSQSKKNKKLKSILHLLTRDYCLSHFAPPLFNVKQCKSTQ